MRKKTGRRRVFTLAAIPPLPDCYVYQNDAAYADRCGSESTRLDLDTRGIRKTCPHGEGARRHKHVDHSRTRGTLKNPQLKPESRVAYLLK
jgi:hypothetical protein